MEKNKSCQSFRLRVHAHFRLPCTKCIEKCQNTVITPAVFYYPLVTPPPLSGILVELPLEDRTCPRVVVVFLFVLILFFVLHQVRTFDFLSSFTLAKQRRVQCAPRKREVVSSIPDLARSTSPKQCILCKILYFQRF